MMNDTVVGHADGSPKWGLQPGLGLMERRWVTASESTGDQKLLDFWPRWFDFRLVRALTSGDDGVTLRSKRFDPASTSLAYPNRQGGLKKLG